ncbi:spore coat U domain-containing protein [Pectobacterium sp. CHL-2024]|uniref:Csu type fimbrial protein n=1 Tax=Pectobacterium TaxID=122277 RepID=UPI000C1C0B7D|nr:spore coat U domain-containing protein [Pectobacterium brasiliense]ATV45975.1 spore coat protein U [Pectobacterium brasiliense]MBA0207888.1 spore coat protein U domain-containing protein [Pectobacterium brasiliense]MCA6983497.1 spore coat U domain-containing protein [Pectobacterium brasiliense]MCH4993049.1 spore coat protein U domain-containing protein [Pectobacterium brasiliense]
MLTPILKIQHLFSANRRTARSLRLAFLSMALYYAPFSYAACTTPPSNTTLGPYASSVVGVNGTPQVVASGSGFRCTGSVLSLASTNTITATIQSDSNPSGTTMRMRRGTSTDYVPYSLCMDSGCGTLYNINSTYTWTRTTFLDILGLFNSTDGTMPIYIRTSIGNNISAGTYTDTVTIKWDYRLCALGALGLCVYDEGSTTSTLNITMNITNDCQITSAPNINFGVAAFPADFAAVNNSLGVRCTLLGAYTVKLVSTHPDDANWRRMTATVGGTPYYLQYQLYRTGNVAWTETNDYSGTGTGITQSIPYTARINASQASKPEGAYKDTVTINVTIN